MVHMSSLFRSPRRGSAVSISNVTGFTQKENQDYLIRSRNPTLQKLSDGTRLFIGIAGLFYRTGTLAAPSLRLAEVVAEAPSSTVPGDGTPLSVLRSATTG